jgi:ribosomal protein L17
LPPSFVESSTSARHPSSNREISLTSPATEFTNPATEIAQQRFVSAAQDLQKVIPKTTFSHLRNIAFPDFNAINGTPNKAKALREVLDTIIEATSEGKATPKKREVIKKIGDIVISCFNSSYLFANLFLTVSKNASAVSKNNKNALIS